MRLLLALFLFAGATLADEITDARRRWEASPHGPMLERILPPTFALEQLPERESRGAKLVVGYCVQCHNLPNPAMHHAAKWPGIVQRMVLLKSPRAAALAFHDFIVSDPARRIFAAHGFGKPPAG